MKTTAELINMLDEAFCISTIPNKTEFPKYRPDFIIDENKSNVWNREQVAIANQRYLDEVKRLRQVSANAISDVKKQIYAYIKDTVGHDISTAKAMLIFDKAWDHGHSAGAAEIFNYILDYIDFAIDILD